MVADSVVCQWEAASDAQVFLNFFKVLNMADSLSDVRVLCTPASQRLSKGDLCAFLKFLGFLCPAFTTLRHWGKTVWSAEQSEISRSSASQPHTTVQMIVYTVTISPYFHISFPSSFPYTVVSFTNNMRLQRLKKW